MKNYFNFKNINVLILGGSSGFGKVYSKTFYDLGANVITIARSLPKLKKLKQECLNNNLNLLYRLMPCFVPR